MVDILQDQIIMEIDKLDTQQKAALLQFIRVMQQEPKQPYNRDEDVSIGLFNGPSDLSERVEDILDEAVRKHGSWTVKDQE